MSELYKPRVGILASGNGTTAHAYAKAVHEGLVNHEIALVVTNNPNARVLERAADWNAVWDFETDTAVVNHRTHPGGPRLRGQTTEESSAICELGERSGVDLFVALGYMVIINDPFIETYGYRPDWHTSKYHARALNTHPGPLPLTADTYGIDASARALQAYHDDEIVVSKHTVHVISAGVDAGPIIAEHDVPVLSSDTPESLNQRTQWIEKATMPYAIDKFWREQQEYWDIL